MEQTKTPTRVLYTGPSIYCAQLLQRSLGESFRITQASSRSAFNRALDEGAADAVLTDLQDLGFRPLALLDHVRASRSPVPVVVFSAIDCAATAVEALKRGAANYVVKPQQQGLLAKALENAASQGRQPAPASRDIDAIARAVSGELRSPLLAIDGFARALARELQAAPTDKTTRYLSRLLQNVRDMDSLVDRLAASTVSTRADRAPPSPGISTAAVDNPVG